MQQKPLLQNATHAQSCRGVGERSCCIKLEVSALSEDIHTPHKVKQIIHGILPSVRTSGSMVKEQLKEMVEIMSIVVHSHIAATLD